MKHPTHYQPERKYAETLLVVDVNRDAAAVGARFRAHMTAQDGGEDSPIAASAAAELPDDVLAWCEENVPVDREACFAIAPEVLAHEGRLAEDYSGGGIAILVHEAPPHRVLGVLKDRALACAKQIGLHVLGFRIVARTMTDTSVAV